MTNPYCDALGIQLPRLERVRNHPEATTFSLLIVALLERGSPMTLAEVAERFEQAGVGCVEEVLQSLRRCRPARAPVWRDGDRYGLDPHDAELDLRVFMLGLRPPRFSPPMRPQPVALPKPDQRLALAELDEAWKNASLYSLSRQRLVLAVLDAHDGPMAPEKVISFVAARTGYHGLTADSTKFKRKGSSVESGPTDDGPSLPVPTPSFQRELLFGSAWRWFAAGRAANPIPPRSRRGNGSRGRT